MPDSSVLRLTPRGRRAILILLVIALIGSCNVLSRRTGPEEAPTPVAPSASSSTSSPKPGISSTGSGTAPSALPKSDRVLPGAASSADDERGRPGTEQYWAIKLAKGDEVAGYVTPSSVAPGEELAIRVSTTAPRVKVEAFRIGAYSGRRGRLIWSTEVEGVRQPGAELIPETRTIVARWVPSAKVGTADWPPGFYLVRLTASSGGQWLTPLIVRSPSVDGRVVLVAPLTTWQAYNDWGGLSLYHGRGGGGDFSGRSYAVSFDRPYAAPGVSEFVYTALPWVVAAERSSAPLAYMANTDIEVDDHALAGARALVLFGHNEYWTTSMRSRVTAARDSGVNLLISGANSLYWRIRLEPGIVSGLPAGLVVGYKSASADPGTKEDPEQATAMWKDPPGAKPTQSLLGTRYECFPVDAPWTIVDSSWWGFAGTGVKNGDVFGHLFASEADRVYPGPETPSPMQIFAHTNYPCHGVPTSAQSLYYTTASGAGVVNLNSLRWGCGLDPTCREGSLDAKTNALVSAVTKNLLEEMAKGPVGKIHPATDNVAGWHLSSTRTVYDG